MRAHAEAVRIRSVQVVSRKSEEMRELCPVMNDGRCLICRWWCEGEVVKFCKAFGIFTIYQDVNRIVGFGR